MVQLVLATSNKGKIVEIQELLKNDPALCDVVACAYSDLCAPFEIEETGKTFQENAVIKAHAVANVLGTEVIVLADDSGIRVPLLGGEPGIYSARYSGADATDRQNCEKLMTNLQSQGLVSAPAYYTACMAIAYQGHTWTVHGWMYGTVCDHMRGDNGFGYDPLFLPEGFDQTLGELDDGIKRDLSHRTKALLLAMKIIHSIKV